MRNQSKDSLLTRVVNATAAGTTNINGTVLSMVGFDAVQFVAALGTLTANQVTKLKAQVGQLADGSDMADLAGAATAAMADADSNKLLVLDVIAPTGYKYIRCVVVRGTANAVIDSVVAQQYLADNKPVTQSSTVSQVATVIGTTP